MKNSIQNLSAFRTLSLMFALFLFTKIAYSQEQEKIKLLDEFSGSIGVTHNGISLVPTFSLGRPATIINIKMRKKRLSFEPEMRFALEGKPWSFLFWWRYKAVEKEKFSLRLGIHPALNFRTVILASNGIEREVIESRRYLASEIVPSYKLSKKTRIGMYYLFSKGLDEGLRTAHFLMANMSFNNIEITEQFYFNVTPQIYYLKLDQNDGFYTAATITFAKKNFPLSIQAIFNQRIKSEIVSDALVWNTSLVYSF